MRLKSVFIVAASLVLPVLLWVVLDLAIETDRERINSILDRMTAALEAQDTDKLLEPVAPDYLHMGLSRGDLRALAESYFRQFSHTRFNISESRVNVSGDRAVANVRAFWRAEGPPSAPSRSGTEWQMTLANRRGEWEVTGVTPVSFDRYELGDWGAILSHLNVTPTGR